MVVHGFHIIFGQSPWFVFFLLPRLRPGFRTGGWNWRDRYRTSSTASCPLFQSTATPRGPHQLCFRMLSTTPLLPSPRDSCPLPRCLLCSSASPFPDTMRHKAPTTSWPMNCPTTINTFFLILLSIQLFSTKWTGNATLYMHYSEKAVFYAVMYFMLRISCLIWKNVFIILS